MTEEALPGTPGDASAGGASPERERSEASDTQLKRCWESSDPAYNSYHDEEWGRPVLDERGLYERLCLEGFQSGLSWLTILRKRQSFRAAFADFEPERVARFDDRDVERLLADAGIVRHRGKIEAAIANARATLGLRESGTPLDEVVWEYRRDGPAPAEWAAQTPESVELSKRLRKAGFRFVGPTTVYAAMQACGIVNDHRADCFVREDVEQERRLIETSL
jgi:DNA-3-methyladenine glycosylase I